mmetsp:Transcript_92256/g.263605  ORF Transcript_92256/g.263605 Transcript_92256/m.263605 type:complete len:119 (-) Transcript_92256:536-892(-)
MTVGGALEATTCVHAVGPNYCKYDGDLEIADQLLRSAYTAAMAIAQKQGLTTVGFSLISAGIYRKPRSLDAVLEIGCEAIVDGAYEGLQEAHLVGFTEVEVQSLLKLVAKLPYPDSLS